MNEPAAPDVPLPYQLTKAVHDQLLPLLAEFIDGEAIKVEDASIPDYGTTTYQFDVFGFRCSIDVRAWTDEAAIISARVRVARFFRGYARALRWCSCNRNFDSIALSLGEEALANQEIWLSSVRETVPGDMGGMRAMLVGLLEACINVDRGLRMWFPQALRGGQLAAIIEHFDEDSIERAIVTAPRVFLAHVDEEPDHGYSGEVVRGMARWLQDWERVIAVADAELAADAFEEEDERLTARADRIRPLFELQRYELLVHAVHELLPRCDAADQAALIGVEAEVLYEQERYEDALELLQPSELDNSARVCLIRALSHGRLRQVHEALGSFGSYGELVGYDIFARARFREALPESELRNELADEEGA